MEPAVAFDLVLNFLKRIAGADGHRLVLRANDIPGSFLRSAEFEPGMDSALSTLFGPLPAQERHVDVVGLGFEHAGGAFLRCGVFRWPLDIEDGATLRKKRSKLAPLDAADFDVIGRNG